MHGRTRPILLASVMGLGCGGRELPTDAVVPDVSADASSDALFSCAQAMMDVYVPNMTKMGSKGLFGFQLVESRPAPSLTYTADPVYLFASGTWKILMVAG